MTDTQKPRKPRGPNRSLQSKVEAIDAQIAKAEARAARLKSARQKLIDDAKARLKSDLQAIEAK